MKNEYFWRKLKKIDFWDPPLSGISGDLQKSTELAESKQVG